jgi:hydrogenase-4 component E
MDSFVTAVLLLSTLYLFRVKKTADAVIIIAVQSAGLAAIGFLMWEKTGMVHLFIASILTVVVKTLIIPYILYYTVKKTHAQRLVARTMSQLPSLFIALLLIVLGEYVASHLSLPGAEHGMRYLSAAIILVFLGTFTIINNKQVIMQGIGVIVIENGLFLITQALSYGMPLVVELGVFFDLFVAVVIIASLAFKIHTVFHSLDTEKMQDLRG